MFYVGQKVVCVDDKPKQTWGVCGVKEGTIYTIVWVEPEGQKKGRGLKVLEAKSLSPRGYDSSRFRPVVNTDISIFTAMLKTTRQGVDA